MVLAVMAVTLSIPDTVYWLLQLVVIGLFELLEVVLDEILAKSAASKKIQMSSGYSLGFTCVVLLFF